MIEFDQYRPTGCGGEFAPSREFAFNREEFLIIAGILKANAGIHLTETKMTLVYSRLAKRVRALGLSCFRDYCNLLEGSAGAVERLELVAAMTTNVTRFFRESHHFDHMQKQLLPSLLTLAKRGGRVRFWSAAASTGQEPFSIAMTLLSSLPGAALLDIKILATDIDDGVLQVGRVGHYTEAAMEGVPPEMKNRYFKKMMIDNNCYWQITEDLRQLVTFQKLNLHESWPMRGRFQAIFCRNVVIYFDQPSQREIWNRLVPQLTDDGVLYIGHSERIGGVAARHFRNEGITTYRRIRGELV